MSVAPRSATRNRIVVLKVASIARKDQVDSFTKLQRIESTTVWRRKKMRLDRVTAESEKLSVVRQQRYPLQVAPLKIENAGARDLLIPRNLQRNSARGRATGTK
jgi:hypothetical protein